MVEISLTDKAIAVYGESLNKIPLENFDEYYKRVRKESLGLIFPYFQSRTFWLRAVHFFSLKVPIRYSISVMAEKNKIYGQRQLYLMGTLGILIRSIDKIERIKNIEQNTELNKMNLVQQESIKDNYMDLFNYAILAVLVMDRRL